MHRIQYVTLILSITLACSMADGGTARESVHRSVPVTVAQGKHTRRAKWRKSGQQAIDANRVREIQAALIRENYLDSPANGVWNQRSKQSMARFQSDSGWQSKVVPDSRALIKLGLGPDHVGLINPDTAAIGFIPGGGTPISTSLSQP